MNDCIIQREDYPEIVKSLRNKDYQELSKTGCPRKVILQPMHWEEIQVHESETIRT